MQVLVVWETVASTLVAPAAKTPPTSRVLGRIQDPRAAQFWDPAQLTSSAIKAAASRDPAWRRTGYGQGEGVIWDTVAVFPAGVRWNEGIPVPDFIGSTVIRASEELKSRL